ncbi:MAG: ABC transporter ATP-binding protein [Trueperaceae bacterium]|nr:ABC transporter ATP-binding protein [Trueperaceae bacterium]
MARPTNLRQSLPSLRRVIGYFWPYVRQEKPLLFGSFFAMFLAIGFQLLEPWPLKFIFDYLILGTLPSSPNLQVLSSLNQQMLLIASSALLVVATACRALADYRSTIGFALIGNRVLTQIRGKLYRHLQRLSLNFHNESKDGDVVVRMISDVGMLKEVAVTAFLPMLGDALVLLGMFGIMLALQWQLALISLAVLPLFFLTSERLSKRIQEVSRQQRQREGAMATTAAESIGAIKTVQALALEESFAHSFSSQNQKSLKDGVKAKRLQARLERSVDILTALATAMVVYMGARFITLGVLSPGDLIVFMAYLKSAFKPIKNFAKYTGRLAKASASGERIIELFEQEVEIKESPRAKGTGRVKPDIRFDNVSFRYKTGKDILKNLSFEVRAGERIALVGASGNGKSSLLSLIPRLYDPSQGRILLGGLDIRGYTLNSLRGQMSMVLQESQLFGMTVKENICLGLTNISPEELLQATLLANAHEFIMQLPNAYDTVLGERGATLSGGQRQRLAIARAALRKAPILLLDEPTAGLDEENERLVLEALERLSKDITTFWVTHDLKVAAKADRIFVIENGQLLEAGSHDNLLLQKGRYASLYYLQQGKLQEPSYAFAN